MGMAPSWWVREIQMAFTIGRLGWRSRFLRLQWGVSASLFAAFAVIAGMGLLINIGAGLVLGHLGERMVDLSARDIPRLAASLQLSAQSASLASQGPALLASRSEESLSERVKKIKETQAVAFDKLGEVIELGADRAVVAALTETVKNIDDNIKSLVAAARERLEVAAQHEKQYDALRSAQAGFVAAANPAMLDAQIQINAILGSAFLSQDDATQAARTIDQLGNVVASGNLSASEMTAALSANSSDTLEAVEKEFKAAQARQIEPRFASAKFHDQGAQGRSAEIAGAGRGQDRRL
jgi:phosphoglycerate-specific signal transduction histidine kinase